VISVVTPSFRQLDWLKLCVASVADQEGPAFEHIVQDAGTGGELEAWARTQPGLRFFSEEDGGMYDAINRGLRRAQGEICAYLNCDEQYLPGALAQVDLFFRAHPDIDVLFGDAILLDSDGLPLSYRRIVLPSLLHTKLAHLGTLTCATFFRRSILERGIYFRPEWKAIGDGVWMQELLGTGTRMATLRRPLAAFTFTGANLGGTEEARREAEAWRRENSSWSDCLRTPAIVMHRMRKFFARAYRRRSFELEIYTLRSPAKRERIAAKGISCLWPAPGSRRSYP